MRIRGGRMYDQTETFLVQHIRLAHSCSPINEWLITCECCIYSSLLTGLRIPRCFKDKRPVHRLFVVLEKEVHALFTLGREDESKGPTFSSSACKEVKDQSP